MGAFSIWHWIIYLLMVLGFALPIAKIANRAGLSQTWALFCIVPLLTFIPLLVIANSQWSSDGTDTFV